MLRFLIFMIGIFGYLNISYAQTERISGGSSVEEEIRKMVEADHLVNGVPRKVSGDFILVKSEAVGKKLVKTYEFSKPISGVSNKERQALSEEALNRFRLSVCNSKIRPLLKQGLVLVQKINYYHGENIITTELSERNCR